MSQWITLSCIWAFVHNPPKASLLAQLVNNPPTMQVIRVWFLGWEDPLEKATANHVSILAWKIPWNIQSMGSQRIGHDWVTFTLFTIIFLFKFYLYLYVHACSVVSDSLWPHGLYVAHQAPFSMGFAKQEYWCGLLFPPQGIFQTQGNLSLASPKVTMGLFTTAPPKLKKNSWDHRKGCCC